MSDYLPEEVVLEILHRLPVKSLIRFRCVSKSWNSLITTPAFINSHLTRSHSLLSNSNKLIVRHCLDKPYVEHYKIIDDSNDSFDQIQNIELPLTSRRIQHFRLIGSANGLFSLFEQERYILWNPSIRKFITLPKPCITVKAHGRITCRPAFGFDPRTNDYKVVRIAFPSEKAKPPLIEAYSLKEDSWKLTSASFPPGIGFSDWCKPAASLGGVVHFAVYDNDNGSRPLVLSFDLGDEVCHFISLPNCAFSWSNVQTSVIGGSLSLLFYDDRFVANKCCAIWVMKEYGVVDSWTKLYTVDLNKEIIRVLCLRKNGNILVEVNLPSDWELSSYDPKSQHIKSLGICGRVHYFHVDNYVENLVLLDKPNDAVSKRGACRKRKCRLTSDKEICQLQEAKHLLEEILQHASVYELQLDIIHQQQTIIHQQEAILLPLQEAILHDGRALQLQEALLYELETILQQQTEKIASLISQIEIMETAESKLVLLIQRLKGQAEVETMLQQKTEKMTSLKSQLEKMDTIKSKLVSLIQQFRGQAGEMFSGVGDQSSAQAQQRSSSAGQEM
ncbi:F-box/kelch-repeat protein At3g06240-like [Castanea sativa]|uniref:F-box/kelch-repeat protein At3g06240-like n=1 Tax=Castanea sativa TaxID=21020 RepID=UPI003F64947B